MSKPVDLSDRRRLELTRIVLAAIDRIQARRAAWRFVHRIMER